MKSKQRLKSPRLPSGITLPAILTLLACGCLLHGAETSSPNASSATGRVGRLGETKALVFEGNQTFTKDQILAGLSWQLDYHLAAHRLAPAAAYAAFLERKVALGYRHAGFPEVAVQAAADPDAQRMVVRVVEGPRFLAGEVVLSGIATMTNQAVRQKILDKLSGLEAGNTNLNQGWWRPQKPVAFDEPSVQGLQEGVREALADLNYYKPTIRARIQPDPATKVASLHIEIADEGIKGVVESIDFNGLRVNTRAVALEFLNLRPGMEMTANLAQSISNRLRNSGRFLHQEVSLSPLPEVGRFKLALDLEELPEAPPLNQALSPAESVLMKNHAWLMNLARQPEDLTFVLDHAHPASRTQVEGALSSAGLVLLVRSGSNAPPSLRYAVVAAERGSGFYASWRSRKLVPEKAGQFPSLFLKIEPNSNPGSSGRFQMSLGGAFSGKTDEGGRAFRLDLDLHPAAFLDLAHHKEWRYALSNDVPTFTLIGTNQQDIGTLQLDPTTGRILHFTSEGPHGNYRLRTEEGAFARLIREIATQTADHPNEHVPDQAVASWLAFMLADLPQAQALLATLEAWMDESEEPDSPASSAPGAKALLNAIERARILAGTAKLVDVLQPLNRLLPVGQEEEEPFLVLLDPAASPSGANPQLALIAAWAVGRLDDLLVRDAWPWVLGRETLFTLAGQGKFTEAELAALHASENLGPLGCLATASLLGRVDPKRARSFAELGLTRLNPEAWRRDYRTLFENDSVTAQTLANCLGVLRSLTDDQIKKLADGLPAGVEGLTQLAARSLRDAPDQSPASAVSPVVEATFSLAIQPWLEAGLKRFLPQAAFLTDPQALYDRALSLLDPKSLVQDVDEAAQCLRKAAEQGHAGAQLRLGILHVQGKGVPEDFALAMSLFQKALAQKQPHAACQIADLYRDGKGVKQDLAEAAKFYHLEADGDCAGAQSNLGRILEFQHNLPEALKYFRRAAEHGEPMAQAHLAEILSDGLTVPADYVEACQWLILAAKDTRNRLIQVELRRIKAKLTPPQLEEAQRRADAVAQHLEEHR